MDLSHIPMRGFPQPHPLVLVSPSARRVASGLRVLAVVSQAALIIAFATAAACVANFDQDTPLWLHSVWKLSLIGLAVTTPLTIISLWQAKARTGATASLVLPVRVVRYEAAVNHPSLSVAQFAVSQMAAMLTGPLAILSSSAAGRSLDYPEVEYEYIHNYQIRSGKARIHRDSLALVKPGDIVWLVPWGPLRAPTTWSELYGHNSPLCKVSAPVADWFERASARAIRIAQGRRSHSQLLRLLGAAQKRRAKYGKRA